MIEGKVDLVRLELGIFPDKKSKEPKSREIAEGFANYLVDAFTFRTFRDTSEIFYYDTEMGIYCPADNKIEEETQQVLKDHATNWMVKEVLHRVRRKTFVDREKLDKIHLIPMHNGIYNREAKELIGYSPEHFFTYQHPINHDSAATCPKINAFLSDIAEGDKEKVQLLKRVIGYAFHRGYPIHQFIIAYGEGDNGKSKYLELAEKMIGEENTSPISLQDLTGDRFAGAQLYGKCLNVDADLTNQAVKNAGLIKKLTGEDFIYAQDKGKRGFHFRNIAKLLYSCNELPPVDDDSRAYFKRVVLVHFGRVFTLTEQDPGIIQKITTPEEMSGFFNECMEELDNLLEEKTFRKMSPEMVREIYLQHSNSVAAFIEDNLELDLSSESVAKTDIVKAYQAYCAKNRITLASDNALFRKIYEIMGKHRVTPCKSTDEKGKQYPALKGVRLILSAEESLEQGV